MNSKKAFFILVVLLAILLDSCAQPATPTVIQTMEVVKTVVVTTPAATKAPTPSPLPRISEYGKYQGYSKSSYITHVKSSQYIPVRDGTRLAADIYRPAVDGQAVDARLPVVWMFARYHRDQIKDLFPWYERMILYSYVIVSVDVRGSGASYGSTQSECFSPNEAQDAYDVTEWLASQPWSDGNIGMLGISYMAQTQYEAAGAKPPHLKAIFPEQTNLDCYFETYPGGIYDPNLTETWQAFVDEIDAFGVPVDEDIDKSMLAAAIKDHAANPDINQVYVAMPYRDSRDPKTGVQSLQVQDINTLLEGINDSQLPIYHLGGWYDYYPRDTLLWYANLTTPQKIVMGPWSHGEGVDSEERFVEHLRWFDYWLKGIDNGIMQEPPIRYYTMGADQGWRTAQEWPLPDTQLVSYYLSGGLIGSDSSVNDGGLNTDAPIDPSAIDIYQLDYSTSQGDITRGSADSQSIYFHNQVPNEEKGLTYTTDPLVSALEVTGHPILHLWVTSSATDGDFFVYLTDVTDTGLSLYITEGKLRASHRAIATAPYNGLGLPYHRSFKADIADLPVEPVELVFDLLPTSYVFGAGHRIRVTIVGADIDNYATPVLDPAPTVSIYRDAEHASYIELPVIPAQ
jgi:uncharacterized protein